MNKEGYVKIVRLLGKKKGDEQKAEELQRIIEPLLHYHPKKKFEIRVSRSDSIFIESENIFYAEGTASYINLHYQVNGVRKLFIYTKNLKKLALLFAEFGLLKIQKSFVVNLDQVLELKGSLNDVILKTGDTIKVSRDMVVLLKLLLAGDDEESTGTEKAA